MAVNRAEVTIKVKTPTGGQLYDQPRIDVRSETCPIGDHECIYDCVTCTYLDAVVTQDWQAVVRCSFDKEGVDDVSCSCS